MAERLPTPDLGFLDAIEEDPMETLLLFLNSDFRWKINNSSMRDYSRRAYINGSVGGLSDILEERLGGSEGNVGLELAAGSKAQAVHDLMESGVLGRALVTNYRNRLPRQTRQDPRLDHIKGNLIRKNTWEKIIRWQRDNAPEGFDLIMNRPIGGLQYLEPAGDAYGGAAHLLIDMVREGGVMFTQVPRGLRRVRAAGDLEELCQSIQERPDVEDVLTTTGRPGRRIFLEDESDLYAVILKK